jgi:hypothetical protein
MVAAGAIFVRRRRLQHRADRPRRLVEIGVPVAADRGCARGGHDQVEQHPQGGGLAGAVRAEEPGDPARLDGERRVAHRGEVLVLLGQPRYDDASVSHEQVIP